VFTILYNFTVERRTIPGYGRPGVYLNQTISNVASEYDEPNTLLIVYYAGHGFYDDILGSFLLSA